MPFKRMKKLIEFISQNMMFKTSIRYSTVVGLAAEVYHVMPCAH